MPLLKLGTYPALLTLTVLSFINAGESLAQGYAGTGLSLQQMENLCQMAALGAAAGRVDPRDYIDKTLQGRFAVGNSTMSQYKKQKAWFQSNCPAY